MKHIMSAILAMGLLAVAAAVDAAPDIFDLAAKQEYGPPSGTTANGYFALGDRFLSGGGGW